MKRETKKKPLRLKREVVRLLTSDLERVQGGATRDGGSLITPAITETLTPSRVYSRCTACPP